VVLEVGAFEEARITGDPALVRRLLIIVLDNAIKYTPQNGRVRLDVTAADGRRTVIVTDTGIGIPSDQLPAHLRAVLRGDQARHAAEAPGWGSLSPSGSASCTAPDSPSRRSRRHAGRTNSQQGCKALVSLTATFPPIMRLARPLLLILFPVSLCASATGDAGRRRRRGAAARRPRGIGPGRHDGGFGAARAARAFPIHRVGSYSKDTRTITPSASCARPAWLRSPRIGAAEAARDAARYRFAFERAAIRFDVDTSYTRGLAAALHARLSRRTALDADSLLRIAELRRDVGT